MRVLWRNMIEWKKSRKEKSMRGAPVHVVSVDLSFNLSQPDFEMDGARLAEDLLSV